MMERSELLVELGTEEIPASMLESAAQQFARALQKALAEERLSSSLSAVWYTPRRIIVGLGDLPRRQDNLYQTVVGPPKSVGYDPQGAPTKAALAFAQKHGAEPSQIKIVQTPKGEYLSLVRKVRGLNTTLILKKTIPAAIAQIQFPKTMYWSADKFRFARPLRWIVALFDGRVVPFRVADVTSSRYSAGHRFTGKQRIAVSSLAMLRERLRENGVVADPAERQAIIVEGLAREAAAAGGELLGDPDLLETVINLNEDPSIICGSFETRFLQLPKEILVTVMREHQKYFVVLDKDGNLLPVFLAVVNLGAGKFEKIRAGHERVLRARLADASFFWQFDRRTSLRDREPSLRNVLFQEKLGSYFDKTQRVLTLIPRMAEIAGCSGQIADLETAAHLFKCDLVTEMVKEFPDLQGVVGGLYCRAEGYPAGVWRAVYDHYLPSSTSSPSPATLAGAILALLDRLDTVCGCFSIGLIPTGSRDPFAVRRQGNGILKILLDHRISASLDRLIRWSLDAHGFLSSETAAELKRFFEGRLRFLFEEMGFAYDSINAVLAAGCDDPFDAHERVRALQAIREERDFLSLVSNFKRIVNILAQAGAAVGDPNPSMMEDPAERKLWQSYSAVKPRVEAARLNRDYTTVLLSLASLRGEVDGFFDKVLVMAEDAAVRNNRLALLNRLSQLFLGVADISQIVLERAP